MMTMTVDSEVRIFYGINSVFAVNGQLPDAVREESLGEGGTRARS